MGCQREIAERICEKGADYVLSLKGNQGTLHRDVKLVFEDETLMQEMVIDCYHSTDGSEHGRLETRSYRAILCPEVLKNQHNWPSLKSLVEVTSIRERTALSRASLLH